MHDAKCEMQKDLRDQGKVHRQGIAKQNGIGCRIFLRVGGGVARAGLTPRRDATFRPLPCFYSLQLVSYTVSSLIFCCHQAARIRKPRKLVASQATAFVVFAIRLPQTQKLDKTRELKNVLQATNAISKRHRKDLLCHSTATHG